MSSKPAAEAGRTAAGQTWTLAARLTAWYALSAFTLVLVVTGFLYWALVSSLDREDDEELADKVRILRAVLRDRPTDLAALRQQAEWGWAARQHGQVHVRVLNGRGRVVVETPGMGDVLPPEAFPPPLPADADPRGGEVDLRAGDGKPYRALAARAENGTGETAHVIQVALDRTPEEELLARFRTSLWLVLALAFAACLAGGYQIARRGVGPLNEITATARRIRPANLSERLTTAKLPAELAALAATFNDMLGRLEESFDRLSRFSAAIAHELRTPVNNVRGEIEVALGRPRAPEEYRDVLGSCLEECGRLSRLIDGLLFLARAESPRTQVEKEPLDLGRELAAVREFYGAAAAEAGVTLAVAVEGTVVAELNRPLFQRALGNLVANALAHTPPGGRVTLSAAPVDGRLQVEVTDTGCGIAAAHLPHLFERFHRVDRVGPTGPGVGLGLAIVRGVAELHAGSVVLASESGRGTRVTLSFPGPAASPGGKPGPT
jgi:two-component system heavy metal sensor histidine kinase CusS